MQHEHKTASRIQSQEVVFFTSNNFSPRIWAIDDQWQRHSPLKRKISFQWKKLSVASYSTLWPRYIQLRNGLADKHHANFDFSLVFHGIMSIEINSNSEWIVLEIVIYVYTWCMIFQINFEADVDFFCRGGLCKHHNIIHSWQIFNRCRCSISCTSECLECEKYPTSVLVGSVLEGPLLWRGYTSPWILWL